MARKIKYGKITAVIFITVLIWVWADLALDEVLPDKPAVVVVDESANPKLWVSFNQASSADIRITLSGPHSVIADESRRLKEGKRLEFTFDAAQEQMDKPGDYDLRLLPFLQQDKQIKRRGLKVESCEPDTISVSVVELIKKSLAVRCVDEDQSPIKNTTIEPAQVDMFVPNEWVGDAVVQLTRGEIEHARVSAIEKTPYIVLPGGQTRPVQTTVKITTPPEEDLRKEDTIKTPALGFALSANLQGKYNIKVDNLPDVISPIRIKATPEAKRAYENMRYQVILEIYDSDTDIKSTESLKRELIYNFPDEYLRENQIMLNQQPVIARFKLVSASSAEPGAER